MLLRVQRCAMLQFPDFHEKLLDALCRRTDVSPASEHAQSLILDTLCWLAGVFSNGPCRWDKSSQHQRIRHLAHAELSPKHLTHKYKISFLSFFFFFPQRERREGGPAGENTGAANGYRADVFLRGRPQHSAQVCSLSCTLHQVSSAVDFR